MKTTQKAVFITIMNTVNLKYTKIEIQKSVAFQYINIELAKKNKNKKIS